MPRRNWVVVALATVLSFLIPPVIATAAPSTFTDLVPDASYRACITSRLSVPADSDVTPEQLASITELSCTNRSISDVTGTDQLPNLTKLFLDNNAISDIRPLSASTDVFSLGLANNRISSVSALASLTKLRSVNLAGNRLSDVSVLGILPAYDLTSGTRNSQKAVGPAASAGTSAVVPSIVGVTGNKVTPTTPPGATVSANSVTYAEAGTYEWKFRDEADFYFNGSVTVQVAAASDVTIPDDALRICVNTKIEIDASAQPTTAQLAGATGPLNCRNRGIADLRGIDLMTGLTNVTLTGNNVTDVTPLSTLTNMTFLDIAQNDVASLAGLGSLPKLGTLRVNQTSISTKTKLQSLSGVQRLTGLTSITANYSAVSSLKPLADHPSLKTVNVTHSKVTDVGPLASITSLTSVDLTRNQVADLSALQGRTYSTLKVLDQQVTADEATATEATDAPRVSAQDGSPLVATPPSGTEVLAGTVTYPAAGTYTWTFTNARPPLGATFSGTISQQVKQAPEPVVGVEIPDVGFQGCVAGALGQSTDQPISEEQMAGLEKLTCVNKGIEDLTGAAYLTAATDLILSTNKISDLGPLTGLKTLTKLMLPGNKVTDPSPLATLTGLETLNLSYNQVASIASLSTLINLTDLEVTQRFSKDPQGLTSLEGVEGMSKLTRLVANNSRLTDLTPLVTATSLERLFVSTNQIEDLSPISDLTELIEFGANTNKIVDVSPLAGATKLTSVDLGTNRIADVSSLGSLTNLKFLGLRARGQKAIAEPVPAQMTVSVPATRDTTGASATLTAPSGVEVSDGKVAYPDVGSYPWTFTASSSDGEYFSGTITQQVTEPVSGAADIPDTNLRVCLAEAAGLPSSGIPTEADLAGLTSVDCSDDGVSDLTGVEHLTSTTALNLARNPLTGLEPLSGLTAVTSLDLSGTGLESVAALTGLTSLQTLAVTDNLLSDLSPLGGIDSLGTVQAIGQKLTMSDTPGGVSVSAPTVITVEGTTIAAGAPEGATATPEGARFTLAGTYTWKFSSGDYTGVFTQRATTDEVDPQANDGASTCVAARKVWVIVERDTGLQKGGCASKFATGLEALTSAGFDVTGSIFITAIDGYPSKSAGNDYWSYWHVEDPSTTSDEIPNDWVFSQLGAASYEPKPGSIEGWRFGSGAATPSWVPVVDDPAAATTLSAKRVRMTYGKSVKVPVVVTPATTEGTVTGSIGRVEATAKVIGGRAVLKLPARSLKPGLRRLSLRLASAQGEVTTTSGVKVVKATPKVRAELKRAPVKQGKNGVFRIKVKAAGVKATGRVKVRIASRTVSARLNAKGVAIVKIKRIKKAGKRVAKVRYTGSRYLKSKKTKVKFKVKR